MVFSLIAIWCDSVGETPITRHWHTEACITYTHTYTPATSIMTIYRVCIVMRLPPQEAYTGQRLETGSSLWGGMTTSCNTQTRPLKMGGSLLHNRKHCGELGTCVKYHMGRDSATPLPFSLWGNPSDLRQHNPSLQRLFTCQALGGKTNLIELLPDNEHHTTDQTILTTGRWI